MCVNQFHFFLCFLFIFAQAKVTEARSQAQAALAEALQEHAGPSGMPEWAEQLLYETEARFGGVVLSQATNTSALASMNVTQIEPALDRIVVSH